MTRRNAPCPCGSGRRYKHCCGADREPLPPAVTGPLAETDILLVEGFLTRPECQRLLALASDQPREAARVYELGAADGDAAATPVTDTAATSDRRSTRRITTIVKTHGMAEAVVPLMGRAFLERAAPNYGVRFEWFEWPNILEYGPGGRFDIHADSEIYDPGYGWRRTDDRDYSLLLYLSDDFTGGELEFPRCRVTIRPRAGMLVVFPSDNRYVHVAHPVTSGSRHVLVSWGAVVGTPRLHETPRHRVILTPGSRLPGDG